MPETPVPNLYRRLLQLIPSPCIVCGKSSRAAYSLCPDCETDLPWAGPCCIRCGEELPATSPDPRSCAGCTLHPPPFASCRAAFRYQSPIDSLLSGFKFKARFEAGNVLALLLAEKIAQHYANTTAPELLLPVPLHPKRLRQRGFNQALEITRVVSKKCGIPFSRNAIVKMRDTTAQTEMHSANARKQNLKNAFSVANKAILQPVKSVALIDDVVTTMATVSSVSRELRGCGIRHIEVWCLARASR
ncbi:MAG: ComF family protein [Proteobacteria bacterium]|nr:ComF family protein [Pseudomonadota bacterium]